LFCDITHPKTILPTYRWKQDLKFLSRKEIEEIYFKLYSYFKEEENPIHQLSKLINQNSPQGESYSFDNFYNEEFSIVSSVVATPRGEFSESYIQKMSQIKQENKILKNQASKQVEELKSQKQINDKLRNENNKLKKEVLSPKSLSSPEDSFYHSHSSKISRQNKINDQSLNENQTIKEENKKIKEENKNLRKGNQKLELKKMQEESKKDQIINALKYQLNNSEEEAKI
jgi:hypothetical protein